MAVVDAVLVVFRQTVKAEPEKARGMEGRGGLDVGVYFVNPEEEEREEGGWGSGMGR